MIKMNEDIEKLIEGLEFAEGVFDYMLTPDDSKLLLDYIKQLQNNWNELKKCIEEKIDYLTEIDGQRIPLNDSFEFCSMNELYQTGKYSGFKESLEKMQELEQGKDE